MAKAQPHWADLDLLSPLAPTARFALVFIIKAYRLLISPVLGPHCRFQPTCSCYALEALERHGLMRGGALALRRLARCHPIPWLGGGHGFDPVPQDLGAQGTRTSDV